MAKTGRDYIELREVCRGDFEEIQDDGLQIHVYVDDDELEAIR